MIFVSYASEKVVKFVRYSIIDMEINIGLVRDYYVFEFLLVYVYVRASVDHYYLDLGVWKISVQITLIV